MALISIQEATLKFSSPAYLRPVKSAVGARLALLSEELQKAYERWDYLAELAE